MIQIHPDDVLAYIDRALNGMLRIVEELGDARINLRPDVPGANSPCAILTHCVGLTNYWIGAVIGGRQVERDRDAEFHAVGSVADLRQQVHAVQQHIRQDLTHLRGDQPIAFPLAPRNQAQWQGRRQGTVVWQCYTELAQHHGHMDLTRDLLMQQTAPTTVTSA